MRWRIGRNRATKRLNSAGSSLSVSRMTSARWRALRHERRFRRGVERAHVNSFWLFMAVSMQRGVSSFSLCVDSIILSFS